MARLPRELWMIILKINKDIHDAMWRKRRVYCQLMIIRCLPRLDMYGFHFGMNRLIRDSVDNWTLQVPINYMMKYYEIQYRRYMANDITVRLVTYHRRDALARKTIRELRFNKYGIYPKIKRR